MKNKVRILLSLVAVLISIVSSSPASALPAWCFRYSAVDSFDSSWSLWNSSLYSTVSVGATSEARTPGNAAIMSFSFIEPNGSFLIVEKVFNSALSIDHSLSFRLPRNGCAAHIPYFPSGRLGFCSASVWLKAPNGAEGSLQLIDPDTYVILDMQPFLYPSSTVGWRNVKIIDSVNCKANMLVRIGVYESLGSEYVVADDVRIDWFY